MNNYEEYINDLKSRIISGFYEEGYPQYRQGEPSHELEEYVTAEECNNLVRIIKLLCDQLEEVIECDEPCLCGTPNGEPNCPRCNVFSKAHNILFTYKRD